MVKIVRTAARPRGLGSLLRANRFFFVPYLVFLLAAFALLVALPKSENHLLLSRWHHPVADQFFRFFTHVGDGLFSLGVAALLLAFRRWRSAGLAMASFLLSGGLSLFFKQIVFPKALRPTKYFEQWPEVKLTLVEGVNVYAHNSFPSGHSTTAFAVFSLLALLTSRRRWGLALFVLASLGAYSRVYLSQHFLEDIVAGSLLGTACTVGLYLLWEKIWPATGFRLRWTIKKSAPGPEADVPVKE